jgi:hypothetical protein
MEAPGVLEIFLKIYQNALGDTEEDRESDNEELSKLKNYIFFHNLNSASESNRTIEGITNGNMIGPCGSGKVLSFLTLQL